MNVVSILYKAKLFEEVVLKSGMKRDVNDFIQSIQQAQNRNLTFMKELSGHLKIYLDNLEANDFGNELSFILRDTEPFTNLNSATNLVSLNENTEIDANEYFNEFNNILHQLKNGIVSNEEEVNHIKEIFSKYVPENEGGVISAEKALMSLVFRDIESTKSLKGFSKVLHRWERTLLLYHTLLKSDSPEEISLVEIQNGSIDVVFNVDVEVAVNLAELIKIALEAYGAYLLYKSKTAREFMDSFKNNKKLLSLEEKKEELMLENIKESVVNKAIEQHKVKLDEDPSINKEQVEKKAKEIGTVVTDHIVKGNEVKLLTPPPVDKESGEKDLSTELREEAAKVNSMFKMLKVEDQRLLTDKFTIKDDEPEAE